MNKKVLVLALVLLVAFAGSAMAEVKFSGKFVGSVEQNNFKVFTEEYKIKPDFTLSVKASNKHESESGLVVVESEEVDEETGETVVVIGTEPGSRTDWEFEGALSISEASGVELGKYKLSLHDQYFNAWFWGRGAAVSKKATKLDFIVATAGGSTDKADRVRFEVPVYDYVTLTADFREGKTFRFFADSDYVAGFDLGLAYARDWSAAAKNQVVAYGGTEFSGFDIYADAGFSFDDKFDTMGFAGGVGAETALMDDKLEVGASVKGRFDEWTGGGFAADLAGRKAIVVGADAKYTEDFFQVGADVEQTIGASDVMKTVVGVDAFYRMSGTVDYDDLFNDDPDDGATWYELDAPAVGVYGKMVGFSPFGVGTKAGVKVASPVLEDMIWAYAYGEYGKYTYKDDQFRGVDDKFPESYKGAPGKGFKVGADLYIQATDKLVVEPFASFASYGKVLTLGSHASYKIGFSDTTLDLTAKRVTADAEQSSEAGNLLKASVTVPF